MQVKMYLTGSGRADKNLVQITVKELLKLPNIIRPDDAADAVAIAVCHSRLSFVTKASSQMENSACVSIVSNRKIHDQT